MVVYIDSDRYGITPENEEAAEKLGAEMLSDFFWHRGPGGLKEYERLCKLSRNQVMKKLNGV